VQEIGKFWRSQLFLHQQRDVVVDVLHAFFRRHVTHLLDHVIGGVRARPLFLHPLKGSFKNDVVPHSEKTLKMIWNGLKVKTVSFELI